MSNHRLLDAKESKSRAPRIAAGRTIIVQSRTIGAPMAYTLGTANLSRTGLLMTVGGARRLPFLVNTLLELTVDPRAAVFRQPVNCLAKIVRVDHRGDDFHYGVQIVQMEAGDQSTWEQQLAALEQTPAQPALSAAG